LCSDVTAQSRVPVFFYKVSMPRATEHYLHVHLESQGWNKDTIVFKMPKWMPGYYQLMQYGAAVENFTAKNKKGKSVFLKKMNDNSWVVAGVSGNVFTLDYDITASKKFVANSYVDSTHAYFVPNSVFMYVEGYLQHPVTVEIETNKKDFTVVTGLNAVNNKAQTYIADNFDFLYDCPFLIGPLESLPAFKVKNIEHRFIGYAMGDFDKGSFMRDIRHIVEAATNMMGDIPYSSYTFIGIGPGQGGIEHLNNTTVSFSGKNMQTAAGRIKTMHFLAHEYFHHYNVKRIRPLELGPFNYDAENKTNLLWVSEGLSVYYEYMLVKRAGIDSEADLLNSFESNINTIENSEGRLHQSLVQASYETWSDGPFGKQGEAANKSISYYEKGPVVGLLLDFAIKHASHNTQSLDDVMRLLYNKYYKQLGRGFTDAEFQQACETVAGAPLTDVFEYVYTTRELDYSKWLGYAGLSIEVATQPATGRKQYHIKRMENPDKEQLAILNSWLNN
jgi:predicted metalloprotease with PDZ domain